MKLSEYFEKATGLGHPLATADSAGAKVNAAVYAKPHFIDEETVAFIMADGLTHHNVQQNPRAAYLFKEAGEKVRGQAPLPHQDRKEIQDPAARPARCAGRNIPEVSGEYSDENKFVVYLHRSTRSCRCSGTRNKSSQTASGQRRTGPREPRGFPVGSRLQTAG
ncbi:MAG: pyridoxamine 5'-phosphate oxidase family protein [Desulfobacterales bacterium]|nr:pyridoxamine 5'-phosphate oxidase family protein [Desulfobacterales bacterium]